MVATVTTGLSKEAFIFETVLELIKAKEREYKFGHNLGITISGIGQSRERPRSFKISRKTKWASFKALEAEGIIRHLGHAKGKDYTLTDEAWEAIKAEIIKFHLVKKE
jgi:hypothetical protein